eukprot:TRINITY_DN27651_c1_g1_i1.p1 TRINITY_DN27651_c1_g1~~TRINITY_DN27651_c1_g1_i1.p1  ORF type:complete len:123 (+),score=4.60 TRINITY_DN27651_c1_g1_i1:903-1271(+)
MHTFLSLMKTNTKSIDRSTHGASSTQRSLDCKIKTNILELAFGCLTNRTVLHKLSHVLLQLRPTVSLLRERNTFSCPKCPPKPRPSFSLINCSLNKHLIMHNRFSWNKKPSCICKSPPNYPI